MERSGTSPDAGVPTHSARARQEAPSTPKRKRPAWTGRSRFARLQFLAGVRRGSEQAPALGAGAPPIRPRRSGGLTGPWLVSRPTGFSGLLHRTHVRWPRASQQVPFPGERRPLRRVNDCRNVTGPPPRGKCVRPGCGGRQGSVAQTATGLARARAPGAARESLGRPGAARRPRGPAAARSPRGGHGLHPARRDRLPACAGRLPHPPPARARPPPPGRGWPPSWRWRWRRGPRPPRPTRRMP
jgi:hypothetical protein